jgi:hypothetical protein
MTTNITPDLTDPAAAPPTARPPTRSSGSSAPPRPSRWWIAAVPLAVAAMLAANGYRVSDFWYYGGLNHEIASGEPNEWVAVSEKISDAHGDTARTYRVRLAGLGGSAPETQDTVGDEVPLADGMVARTVKLDFSAAPDQPLKNCALTLIDDEGREYRVGGLFDRLGPRVTTCVPEDTPGPSLPVLKAEQRGSIPEDEQPRPAEWSASPAVVVPEDARFVELRISFENPDYVSLRLPR